uniref:Dipeptidase n=1 Tax=Cyprinus carpio carpio TaxID=630221 RepID=A0A8C1C796_CYPCA
VMDWVKTVCLVLWVFTFNSVADDLKEHALKLMTDTPLIDGHNDLPWQMKSLFNNQLNTVDLYKLNSTHTNIPKIKEGHISAQFWAAYVPCNTQYKDAVRQTLEQIDVIHRMCHKYPEVFKFATSSQDILDAFEQNKTASLIGVEGGHSIDSSLGTLRTMYQLGVRYLTITHSCNTPWADNWLVDTGSEPEAHGGLSDFGKQVIREMNRIGMLIDLSHVSEKVMNQVLDISEAPVIFSHSSAYSICNHKRNVPDDVLMRLVSATLTHVHFHIHKAYVLLAGSSIIGFGGDYDGVPRVPDGLEDVSKYPDLVAELLSRKWSDEEIRDALGRNLLRVFREVEEVRDHQNGTKPDDIPIPFKEVQNSCRTDFGYQYASSSTCIQSFYPVVLVLTLLNKLL